MRIVRLGAALTALLLLCSGGARAADPVFRDVTQSSGLIFRHHGPIVDEKLRNLGPWFTALGAGGAVGDIDNSGRLSVYLTNSLRGTPNALFINKGNMQFEEHAADWGIADVNDDHNYSMTALFVDLNNSGYKDLVLVRAGHSLIYRNIHGERFELVADALINAPSPRNPVAVVALDYDHSGYLSLYFGCYCPDVDLTEVSSGRGLLLIRTFMDEVVHNERGNEITMVKELRPPSRQPESHNKGIVGRQTVPWCVSLPQAVVNKLAMPV